MNSRCFDIKVGQEVFLRPTGNFKRKNDDEPEIGSIVKIARKYFYVKIKGSGWPDERFRIEDFTCDGGDRNAGYIIYESKEAYDRAIDHERIMVEIRGFFRNCRSELSYEAAKKIIEIIEEERRKVTLKKHTES